MEPSRPDQTPLHPIGVVSRRTGLKPDLVRAWERRYGAVRPARSSGGRRLYSEADVARLRLLSRATRGGHSIGQVVDLPEERLRELAGGAEPVDRPAAGPARSPAAVAEPEPAEARIERCLEAVMALDSPGLLDELERAAAELARRDLVETLLEPLMRAIGLRWRAGELQPAHEHLATATVRLFVARLPGPRPVRRAGPGVVVTTPAGERHELGALLVAATAATEGWHVVYLGADLPAEDIVLAVRTTGARAVTLSVACPDAETEDEIRRLAGGLPDGVDLLVGGRGATRLRDGLSELGVRFLDGLEGLRRFLATAAG